MPACCGPIQMGHELGFSMRMFSHVTFRIDPPPAALALNLTYTPLLVWCMRTLRKVMLATACAPMEPIERPTPLASTFSTSTFAV